MPKRVAFALAVKKIIGLKNKPILLAGKSTLNRIEHCPETVSKRAYSRYHRIGHDAEAISKLLVEIFLESYSKAPRQIILDLDVTDDLVHGNQEQAFFNTYYGGYGQVVLGECAGAIAYLKEALRTWKGVKSPEAVFVAAYKKGRKPESAQAKSEAIAWFEWARRQRIVIAMSGEVMYTSEGEAVELAEMMRRFPVQR